MGEARKEALRLGFDGSIRLEFHGATVSSDGGMLAYRDVDDALALTATAGAALTRRAHRDQHPTLAHSAVAAGAGGRATAKEAASTSQMARFETDVLTHPTTSRR